MANQNNQFFKDLVNIEKFIPGLDADTPRGLAERMVHNFYEGQWNEPEDIKVTPTNTNKVNGINRYLGSDVCLHCMQLHCAIAHALEPIFENFFCPLDEYSHIAIHYPGYGLYAYNNDILLKEFIPTANTILNYFGSEEKTHVVKAKRQDIFQSIETLYEIDKRKGEKDRLANHFVNLIISPRWIER
jgi:hypothetical protein